MMNIDDYTFSWVIQKINNVRGSIKVSKLNKKIHHNTEPALVKYEGDKVYANIYYHHGEIYRKNGPAIILFKDDISQFWWISNKKIHRVGGPAVTTYINNKLVETIYVDNDKLHRENLPAYVKYNNKSSIKLWYNKGKQYIPVHSRKRTSISAPTLTSDCKGTSPSDIPHVTPLSDTPHVDKKNKTSIEKLFECNECEYISHNKNNFASHIITHSDERIFRCMLCDKSFKRKAHLERHKIYHNKKYKYKKCNIEFSGWRLLKYHETTHLDGRSYKCDQCEYSSKRIYELNSHKLIHTHIKIFKCAICDMSFRYLRNLKIHSKLHSGKKSFKCDICDSEFNRKYNLTFHYKKYHSEPI